jgi:hypothetical protein
VPRSTPCRNKADPYSASRARQTAARKKKRGTPFGMTHEFRFPRIVTTNTFWVEFYFLESLSIFSRIFLASGAFGKTCRYSL